MVAVTIEAVLPVELRLALTPEVVLVDSPGLPDEEVFFLPRGFDSG